MLLNEADAVARERGWVSSGVLECNEDDDLPLLMARLCHRALRRLSTGKRVGSGVKRALGVLRAFTFAMDEHGAWRFNIDVKAVTGVADSGDPEADIVELLGEVGAAAAQHGSGAAFLLDEVQFLGRRDLATLAAAMHGISQQNAPVLLVAAGLPQLPLMLKNAKPYAERLFDYRSIEGLPRATAATALTVPAQRAQVRFDQDALDLILDRAEGYPYFLQQWGETVWREAEGPTITLRDAETAEELVNDELDRRFFRDRYEKATEAERIYMAAMADLGNRRHSSGEISKHLGMAPKELSVRRDKVCVCKSRHCALNVLMSGYADITGERATRRGFGPRAAISPLFGCLGRARYTQVPRRSWSDPSGACRSGWPESHIPLRARTG